MQSHRNRKPKRRIAEVKTESPEWWGISSVGRAPALHAGGQEFEPPILHFFKKEPQGSFLVHDIQLFSLL